MPNAGRVARHRACSCFAIAKGSRFDHLTVHSTTASEPLNNAAGWAPAACKCSWLGITTSNPAGCLLLCLLNQPGMPLSNYVEGLFHMDIGGGTIGLIQ